MRAAASFILWLSVVPGPSQMDKEQDRVGRLGREGEGMGEMRRRKEGGERAFQEAQVVCGYRWQSGYPPAISIFSCLRKLEYLPQAGSLSISLFRFTEEGTYKGGSTVHCTCTQSMLSTQNTRTHTQHTHQSLINITATTTYIHK